jgi:hypothetical protein
MAIVRSMRRIGSEQVVTQTSSCAPREIGPAAADDLRAAA